MGQGMACRMWVGVFICLFSIAAASGEPTTKPAKSGKATTRAASQPTNDPIVYITKAGKKYHEADCSMLHGSKISMKLSEAKANGFTPCTKCEGTHAPAGSGKAATPAPASPKAANDEPTYKGKALSEWVKLTHDRDADTRDGAFDALKKMLPDAKAKAAIVGTLQTEDIMDIAQHTFPVAPERTLHKLSAKLKEQIGRKNSGMIAAHVSVIMLDQSQDDRDRLQELARQGLDRADSKDADGWRLLVDTIEKSHAGAATADSSR